MRSRSNIWSAASVPPFRPDARSSAPAVTTAAPTATAQTGASTDPGDVSARRAMAEGRVVVRGWARGGAGARRAGACVCVCLWV